MDALSPLAPWVGLSSQRVLTSVLSSGNAFDLKGAVCEVETLTIKESCKIGRRTFFPNSRMELSRSFIEKVFPWEEVIEAHKLMESNQTMGKLICTID
jgi:hypothetical protein